MNPESIDTPRSRDVETDFVAIEFSDEDKDRSIDAQNIPHCLSFVEFSGPAVFVI
jgi:hypothetical protein